MTADAKQGRRDYAQRKLRPKASRLLVGNKIWLPLVHVSAVWLDKPALGSAWSPITPHVDGDESDIQKAWCAWLNSSLGALLLLERRTKKLAYPAFPLQNLRTLLCPNPKATDLGPLVDAFNATKDALLEPWPNMHQCAARSALDEAAARVARIDGERLMSWRSMIAKEPSVCGRRPNEI